MISGTYAISTDSFRRLNEAGASTLLCGKHTRAVVPPCRSFSRMCRAEPQTPYSSCKACFKSRSNFVPTSRAPATQAAVSERSSSSTAVSTALSSTAAGGPTTVASPKLVMQGTPLAKAKLESHYDAIVIGSGMGGLSAAVALSKFAGQRVLVLEQHYTAGGFTHAFSRGPYAWNVGVHYIGGGMGRQGGEMHGTFNALTDGAVSWAALPEVYDRIIIADRSYNMVTGADAWLQQMTSYFPAERKALEQIMTLMLRSTPAFQSWQLTKIVPPWLGRLMAPFTAREWQQLACMTSAELFGQLTQDPELRAVWAGQYVDIGLPPGQSSAAYQLLLMSHYLEGAFAPINGASSIAAAMIPIIEAAGGAVLTSADVTEVLVTGGKATGVRLATGQEVTCNAVISDAGLLNTYTKLLPDSVQSSTPAIQQQLQAARAAGSSVSAAVLYIGLEGSTVPEFQGFGNIHKQHSADQDGDFKRYLKDANAPLPAVFVSCCDGREQLSYIGSSSSSSSNGYSTMQVATFAPYDHYEGWSDTDWHHRGASYEGYKKKLEQQLLSELGAIVPTLTPDRIAFSELSTPLSTEHFSRWQRGAMYGISVTPAKFKACGGLGFGYRTPIQGLYLCGQDVAGDGVGSAMMTGYGAAVVVGGSSVQSGMRAAQAKWK